MFFNSARKRQSKAVDSLYRSLVEASRHPDFYQKLGVADSIEGRFEMLVLHCGLVVAELDKSGPEMKSAGLMLAEAFFADMDRSLREIGVTDIGVPKKMKKLAEAFYGRLSSYQLAMGSDDPGQLPEAITRNIYAGSAPAEAAAGLARYVRSASAVLAATAPADILENGLRWPQPVSEGEGN